MRGEILAKVRRIVVKLDGHLLAENPADMTAAIAADLTSLHECRADVGTLLIPGAAKSARRKPWSTLARRPGGAVVVDEEALCAVTSGKKGLLPSGIREVRGRFAMGDTISVLAGDGREVARGLVAYASEDIERIRGVHSGAIEEVLGYKYLDEVIHHNDLVVL